jgi:hypothetical protein
VQQMQDIIIIERGMVLGRLLFPTEKVLRETM